MTNGHAYRTLSIWMLVIGLLAAAPTTATAQDALARAKGFYASAEYEEALNVLATLRGKTSNTEAAAYQVFCLVALGRRDEARAAVEAIVRMDPLFRPSEADASPRIRAFFDDVRKPLLPEVTRLSYAKAKTAFDQKDWAPALVEFDRVMVLLDEIGGSDQGVSDLRTLASGFRDLARAASKPVAAPPPPPAPVVPAAAVEPSVYGDEHAGVSKPVPISRPTPTWRPTTIEERQSFSGTIELVINEQGKVVSAVMLESVHPRYDASLLDASMKWTFRPAMNKGVPVKYRYSLVVNLGK